MRKSVVRKHFRTTRKGRTVVKQHMRTKINAHIKDASLITGKNLSSKVSINDKHKAEGTSLGHTATTIDSKKSSPVEHVINLDLKKIKAQGHDLDTMLAHEFAHVIDREGVKTKSAKSTLSKSPKAKELINSIKKSQAFSRLTSKYETAPEELFARAYAQFKTGKINMSDVKTGTAWTRKDFAPIKKRISKTIKIVI